MTAHGRPWQAIITDDDATPGEPNVTERWFATQYDAKEWARHEMMRSPYASAKITKVIADEQESMFDTEPVARATDPETSWEAALSHPKEKIRKSQLLVLGTLKEHGPMMDHELVELLDGVMSPSGARTRRRELTDAGLVADTGYRRKTRSGRRSIVWTVTP